MTVNALDHAATQVRYLEEIEIGTTWTTRARTITEGDLLTFGTWSGDMHPLHTDEEYARGTSFGTRIFHGPGALAVAFGLEMTLGWKIGSAIAFLGLQDWKFLAPVFIGDTLHVREEVVAVTPSRSKADRGIVATKVEVVNQNGIVTQEGIWTVMLSRRPA